MKLEFSAKPKIQIPDAIVKKATTYPKPGIIYFKTVWNLWINCRIIVAAVANKARQIAPRKKTTGPATCLAPSSPYKKINPPRKKQINAITTGITRNKILIP
jgi:hypothetical protein